MSDNPNLRGPRDRARIDIHQAHELRYWSEKFGVSQDELKNAVQQVGNKPEDVERSLGKRGSDKAGTQ
jgi:hypothetical protein